MAFTGKPDKTSASREARPIEQTMTNIQHLELPDQLPKDSALKSCGQSKDDYEPESWEIQYEQYRYLENLDEKTLIKRYRDIHKNFYKLVRPERNIIPIDSGLSSWYWYRKEHQTRYEFYLRNLSIPLLPPSPRGFFAAPIRSKRPNSCDILFRYGNKDHMNKFVQKGIIRISRASSYKDGPPSDPRTDDELNKDRYLCGKHTRITNKDGKEIPIIGDFHEKYSTQKDYYTLCMSTDFEPNIFVEFKYDSCVIIKNPEKFMTKLTSATKNILSKWYFHHNPIEYYDPYEPYINQHVDPVMYKDFQFAYQVEYRAIWLPPENESVKDFIYVTLGSLEDICELYTN